jgi:adenylylsulfate kinase-like enzyme
MDETILARIADIFQNITIEPSVLLLTSTPPSSRARAFCKLPWSCVYTTCRDDSIYTCFEAKNRKLRGIVSDHDCNAISLNKLQLPFVYLLGNNSDDIDPLDQEAITENLLETIPQLLTTFGKIFVDCTDLGCIRDDLIKQLYRKLTRKECVVFLGTGSISSNPYVHRLIDKGTAISFGETLWQLLDILADSEYGYLLEDMDNSREGESSGNTFYIRKKSYTFSSPLEKDLLISVANFAELLTYEEVERANGFPESETMQRFQRFLQSSSSGRPQWYGYRAEHNFHLTRYFEDELYNKTITLLESAASRDRKEKPIILRGQACSGKTNALCALAYRIFHEHNYPVVYIHSPDVDLSVENIKNEEGISEKKKSIEFVALEALLRQIESKSDNPLPTLILWDTSCRLQSELSKASRLLAGLRSEGRLVQVICTSHEINMVSTKKGDPYSYYEPIEVRAKLMGSTDCQKNGIECDEHKKVLQMLVKYGGFREKDAERLMRVYGTSNTFIASLYLFKELHRDLQVRLRRENDGRIEDILDELKILSDEEKERRSRERINTVLGEKLQKEMARVGRQLNPQEHVETEGQRESRRDVVRDLVCCIALCTLYKERLPMTMVVKLLGTIDALSSKIFKVVTASSLIRTGVSSDDEPMVSLRSELEAKLLLESYEISDAEKLRLLEDMIDVASSKEGSKDIRLIQKIIQIIGPNNKDSSLSLWENEFDGFSYLAETLENYRLDNQSMALLLQELTLKRELCNHKKYPHTSEQRTEDLQETQKLADHIMTENASAAMTPFLANLYVEWANTTLRLYKNSNYATMSEIYKDISRKMERVINQFPQNGFAYSVYLWAGINFAETLPDNDEKYELLQTLGNIADTITDESSDIDQGAFGELDNLIDKTNISDDRFQKSIQAGKSYGLYFRIRELLGTGEKRIDFTQRLPKEAHFTKRCRRIVELWQNSTYRPLIENDAACMYALINVKWLLYTRLPIIPDREDNCIKLSLSKWHELYNDCDLYLNKLCRFRSPRIVFLQALAAAHIEDYREDCEMLFDELRKGTNVEIRSYYILCDEEGKPQTFRGQLRGKYNTYKNRGYIKIDAKGLNQDIYFRAERIGYNGNQILEREKFQDLSLAVGYRGFQVCKL